MGIDAYKKYRVMHAKVNKVMYNAEKVMDNISEGKFDFNTSAKSPSQETLAHFMVGVMKSMHDPIN